jgi:hypothetical protein
VGVTAKTPEGELEVLADLTVGADGRHSVVRERAGFSVVNLGAPMDVLWMQMSRHLTDPAQTFGRFDSGRILVFLNREDYWQTAYVIPKGKADELRQQGLPEFRQELVRLAPFLQDRVDELRDWDDIKLLTVAVDRLSRWFRPRTVVHWRCRARHVSHRGRGNQPGHSGRGRDREHPGRETSAGNCKPRRFAGGTATKNVSHSRYAANATDRAEQRDPKSTRYHQAAHASVADKAFRAVEILAANSGTRSWNGISSGARADARSAGCLILFQCVRSRLSDHDRVLHLAEQVSDCGWEWDTKIVLLLPCAPISFKVSRY